MGKESSHVRHNAPIKFDNYALKWWLRDAGARRHELLQKLQKDLRELKLSKRELRRAWIQLTTKPYVGLNRWVKATPPVTNDGDKCGKSMPSLEDSEHNNDDVQDKKDLNNSENTRKMFKCSNMENKEVHADTTSQMASKRKLKFEHMMNERRKYLSNKYKIKSTNKELNKPNNASEIIPAGNEINKIQIPVQIDREKLKITSEVGLSEKEVNNSKSSYNKLETMEADSTVSNDKKDAIHVYKNKNIHKTKDVSRGKLFQSVTTDKFQDDSNVPMVLNQNFLNRKDRKRKRIKKIFRYCFDECLTLSEEEEEESILDLCIHKRQKHDFIETSNDSTNTESHTGLDMTLSSTEAQDTTTNLVTCEDITNNIVCTKASKIKNIKQVKAVSSITKVTECNNDKTISENDVDALQKESSVNNNLHIEETGKSALLDNDEQIQKNLSNELQINIVNYSSEDHSLNSENNAEGKYVEKPSKFKKSIDTERDVLPDSNINNDNCNDTNMKVLTNYAIKIRTSSEKSSSNNNFDEITCHVSQNSYIKDAQLNADSGHSGTAPKILNSTLDSAAPVGEILEISKNTENRSKILQDNVSIDTTKQRESATVTNINFTESHAKNINDRSVEIQIKVRPYTETSKCTLRNTDMAQQNQTNNIPKVYKQCTKNVGGGLSQLLQMDINQNHKIQSDGNTISIQEDLLKDTNQYVTVPDICISNVTNKGNEISSKHSEQNKDNAVTPPILSIEEAILSVDNNTIDNVSPNQQSEQHTKQHTLLDCNAKNTDNFKQPEINQPNKIRVLSSAELGSRWCPTPVNNLASSCATESKLPCHTITERINDNEPCKDSTENTEVNLNSIPDHIQLTLSYIYKIMMRIRTIEKKYFLNNCQNMTTGNQKGISDDEQFKLNFNVLLQEFINLGKELQIHNIDKVVQYAMSIINKHYMTSKCEPISGDELSRYMKAWKPIPLKSAAATPSSDVSASDEQGTNSDSVPIATTKAVPSVSNNPIVMPVTLSFIPNLYVPTVSQSYIAYNNLPKQNIYVSNASNQNHEYNISNLQVMQESSTSISYVPSMQPTYKNIQVLQDNRTSNTNMPYYQHVIQQKPAPIVPKNNVPNVNIRQLKSNLRTAHRMNMHQKSQENLIRNKSELIGQSSIPQRLPQQTVSHNTPQGSQIYMAQTAKNTQVSCSTTLPMHSSNPLPGTNTISQELVFKIWDQLTYCLEKKIVDCRLHDTYDKTYCPLQLFCGKWKQAMNNFMYRRMQSKQSDPPITVLSKEARHMHQKLIHEKWRHRQVLLKNLEFQKQSALWNLLKQKIERKNSVPPGNAKSGNVTVQPEVTQHKSRKHTKNVELEKRQQPEAQSNLKLLNNVVASVCDTVPNASEKNDSVLVESNSINFYNTMVLSDNADYLENVNITASTSSESKTGQQKNMLKTNGVSSAKNGNIEVPDVVHRKKESSLPEQTVTEEIVPVQEEISLPEQITRVAVHMENESSLPEQIIREVAHMENESSLPEQTITEEIRHVQEESSLPEQIIREVVHMEKESSLPEQTITEEIVHVQEEISLPEQIIREAVHMEKESSLLEQTITEEMIDVQEESSLIRQIMRDNTNYLQCNSIQSVTLSDPHIVDVRSISPTSFNKMDNALAPNNAQLSSNESTENNEIKVKIEIPEDILSTYICLQCSKTSTVVCEVCLEAHYCSKECSELHWVLEHYKNCKPYNLKSSVQYGNDAPTTEDTDFDVNYMNVP